MLVYSTPCVLSRTSNYPILHPSEAGIGGTYNLVDCMGCMTLTQMISVIQTLSWNLLKNLAHFSQQME